MCQETSQSLPRARARDAAAELAALPSQETSNPARSLRHSLSHSLLTAHQQRTMEQLIPKSLFLSFFPLNDWHVGNISVCTCFWLNEHLGYHGSKLWKENPGQLSQLQTLFNPKGCPLQSPSMEIHPQALTRVWSRMKRKGTLCYVRQSQCFKESGRNPTKST